LALFICAGTAVVTVTEPSLGIGKFANWHFFFTLHIYLLVSIQEVMMRFCRGWMDGNL
jgi:hypothetical protein